MTSTLEAKAQGENMMTRRWLYSLANRLIDEDDKPRVDQLAKRHRKGILPEFRFTRVSRLVAWNSDLVHRELS